MSLRMLHINTSYHNNIKVQIKFKRKSKVQLWMDNPEKLATLDTQDTEIIWRYVIWQMNNMNQPKTEGDFECSGRVGILHHI